MVNQSFITKGEEIYYRIKPNLQKYDPEDYVVIDVDTEDYFVGHTAIDAFHKAKKKQSDKQFFLAQVGNLYGNLL